MALQSIFHNYASRLPIGAQTDAAFKPGMVVTVGTSGEAKLLSSAGTTLPFGLVADTKGSMTPGAFVNRLSDMGDETRASGYVTVYHGGGEFYLDCNQDASDTSFETGDVIEDASPAIGSKLSPGTTAGTLVVNASATNPYTVGANCLVAVVVGVPEVGGSDAYKLQSGIPNVWEPGYDSDAPKKFVHVKLFV